MKVISLIAVFAMNVAGCCQHHPPTHVILAGTPNAIFNPAGSPVALTDFGRIDWPVAYNSGSTSEESVYHEQFIDVFGWGFDHNDGFLLRRFESDRFGRSRR